MQTPTPDQHTIEIHIPSELGYEKVAMASVAAVARKLGFTEERVDDLKTAVAEACINAIEHGNSLDSDIRVLVGLLIGSDHIQIAVIDKGHKPIPNEPIDRPKRDDFRGRGLFLTQALMDEVYFNSTPGRNETLMVAYIKE